ncbi:hypothetical protein [Arthrobacter sp. EpRS71]|uniref:hypothetical protein n=1 Tax=Arthrobacter sp. EpRS71 TaxID=1743141 RepID=UPI000748905D|nr:hypothetical protein [Arthrobacter sp. EpRS71]KUM36448.1 hypothetical protein AR689_21245 [Arthrobacter sp. EpRS71]
MTDISHSSHSVEGAGGLMLSEHGYTLDFDSRPLGSGTKTITFRIVGPDGQPVNEFTPTHEKELHLIAIRRDMTGFQHVHPIRDQSGTWTIDLEFTPGPWRIFTDFNPSGHDGPMTLSIEASVSGEYIPQPIPGIGQSLEVGGYTVTLEGRLLPGEASELTFSVTRNGQPVTDLQPYLGAFGHLVALRAEDLAYLHVHPEGEPGDGTTPPGPEVSFMAVAPSAGLYRLHLDFQHEGAVITAPFTARATATVAEGLAAEAGTRPGKPGEESHGNHGSHHHV